MGTAGPVVVGLVVGVSRMRGLGWVRWVWVWVWVRCCLRVLLMLMVVVGIPRCRVRRIPRRRGRRRPMAGRWRRVVVVAWLGVVRRVRWRVRRRWCVLTGLCGVLGLRRRVVVRGRLGPQSPRCRFRFRPR